MDHILRREGLRPEKGFDAVILGNIPGGGMSRSASLTLNLILTSLEVNRLSLGRDRMRIIELAQAVENDYIGSPCGQLDQIMIYFARAGMGTHYIPRTRTIRYVPLGPGAIDFRIVSLDTGTVRPGLEKSTYRIRRQECETLAAMAGREFGIRQLADVRDKELYRTIIERFGASHPDLCDRLTYIYDAQVRFARMLKAWRAGDVRTVGAVFRADGLALRDLYRVSGPELEAMCDIARSVPGVLGERMLGGGDKGASGVIVASSAVTALRKAVGTAYPTQSSRVRRYFRGPRMPSRRRSHRAGICRSISKGGSLWTFQSLPRWNRSTPPWRRCGRAASMRISPGQRRRRSRSSWR